MTPQTITLETKLCISGHDSCALCGRWRARTIGMPATYLAGTDDWVCYDCAFGIDPELADFAYRPAQYQRRDHTPFQYDYWGVCPECGRPADRWLNVERDHYLVCLRHGVRWCIGSNLFSGWREEPESLHRANAEFLERFRDVEPCDFPPQHWLDGMVDLLNAWHPIAVKAGNVTLVEMTDHACSSRDEVELRAVKQLYIDTFSYEELDELGGKVNSYWHLS